MNSEIEQKVNCHSEPSYFKRIKDAAANRWAEIIPALTPLSDDVLTKSGNDHSCAVCGGDSTIWPAKDASETGRLACRSCTGDKLTGDGIATVAAFSKLSQGEAATRVEEYLGLGGVQSSFMPQDLTAALCHEKRMPLDAFQQFEPTSEKRGKNKTAVVRVPVYNEKGDKHSYFDMPLGEKGRFRRGEGSSGMFFPGCLPQPGETWHLVEGCKDASALIGIGLQAAGMPTSKLSGKYARLFAGTDVILVPDLDAAGQEGAYRTGGVLVGVAASVRVARLPGEVVEKGGSDVRDVLSRPQGETLVRQAIADAKRWTPQGCGSAAQDGRPQIAITLELGSVVDQVTKCLGELGWATPWIPARKREQLKIYQRGGSLVDVVAEDGRPVPSGNFAAGSGAKIRVLPGAQIPLRISDACELVQERERPGGVERRSVKPPRWLIDGIRTLGDYGRSIRRLDGIITSPTIRADGSILQDPGYDEQSQLLCILRESFPIIPVAPTREDAQRAAGELLDAVTDFPFVHDADRSAWLSLVLSLVGRPAICGCVPLFCVTATCPGSGKTLLVNAASFIALGRPVAAKAYTPNDDEMRKTITAIAMEAAPVVLFDNVATTIRGASMDAALTTGVWSDRVLGSSSMTGELPLRTVWTATGNNLQFASDSFRRILPIRLKPDIENPEERSGFTHPDLLGWIQRNRPRLVVAALTILRAYLAAGRPKQAGGNWGSYESWTDLVRGAIVWAGLADPLLTRPGMKGEDASGAVVRGLIMGLLEMDSEGKGMTVKEIADALNAVANADRFPVLREVVAEHCTDKGHVSPKKLAYCLRAYRGRIVDGRQLGGERNRTGSMRWRVEAVGRKTAGDGAKQSAAPKTMENPGKGGTAGNAEDASSQNSILDSCLPRSSPLMECTKANGDGLSQSPASPASSAVPFSDSCNASSVPCPECGAVMDVIPAEEGWQTRQCQACSHVIPERTSKAVGQRQQQDRPALAS